MSSIGNTAKKHTIGSTDLLLYRIPKKMNVLSTQELKDKVDRIAPKSNPSNYMLPKDVISNNIIISNKAAHTRTLVTENQFRSFIKLCIRFLIFPELKKKKAHLIKKMTDYIWRHSHFNQELLEEVHIIAFLNSIGITQNSLPDNHEKFGDQYRELIYRLCIFSLELVHRIPLFRHRKPGKNNFSWVRNLNGVDQVTLKDNIHLFKDITYKNQRTHTVANIDGEVIPLTKLTICNSVDKVIPSTKNPSAVAPETKTKDGIKSVKVFNYNNLFKKIRSEVWLDGFNEHCEKNGLICFNMLVLPPNYDCHILLSSLYEKKNIALRDGMSLLISKKSKKKRSGNTPGFGMYCDDERTDSEEEDDDD